MTRLLRRAGVSGWPRIFHSMRASRQTEQQREFPLHVVCSSLGNSPRIAQQSYLLVSEDDFAKAAGPKKVMVEAVKVGLVEVRLDEKEPDWSFPVGSELDAPPCIDGETVYVRTREKVFALQLEVSRALYMDESRVERLPNFPAIQRRLSPLINMLARESGQLIA